LVTGEPLSTVTIELLIEPLLIPPTRTAPRGPLALARLTLVIESAADAAAGTAAINTMTVPTAQTSRPIGQNSRRRECTTNGQVMRSLRDGRVALRSAPELPDIG
jgi:hypothetical protein